MQMGALAHATAGSGDIFMRAASLTLPGSSQTGDLWAADSGVSLQSIRESGAWGWSDHQGVCPEEVTLLCGL